MVDHLFGFFASASVPWLLSAIILLTALIIWLDFRWRRLEPVLRGLDDAIRAVEETEGPAAFRQRFAAIFQRLADNPVTGGVWRAYASTLAPSPTSESAIGYTRRPGENFDEGLLALAGINLRFYHAMPNLLVGVGLLFTFMGLVAALYFASSGVAAADVKVAQSALRELLAAATFKFVTSIAGLGSSLVFSWREKAWLYQIHRRLARLCAALEARMVPVTAESLAAAELIELKSQTALLRRFSRDLFIRLPDSIEERMAQEITAGLVPMRQALSRAAARLGNLDAAVLEMVQAGLGQQSEAAARQQAAAPVPVAPPPPVAAPVAEVEPEPQPIPQPEPQPSPAPAAAAEAPRQAKTSRLAPTLAELRAGLGLTPRAGEGRPGEEGG